MNEGDRRRAALQAAVLKKWLDQNPGVWDAAETAQRNYQMVAGALAEFAAKWSKMVETTVNGLGGMANIGAGLQMVGNVLALVRDALPPNWPSELKYTRAIELANDGIPVVWVPPGSVLVELAAAEDRAAQMAVLHAHRDKLLADINRTLDEVTHPSLAGQVPLARAAVLAWAAGHGETAQSLAVTVTEAVITRHFADGLHYDQIRKLVKIDLDDTEDDIDLSELRFAVAIAPIATFYTPWWPSSGKPPPEALSRHVTVHQADIAHYTPDNILVALLLQTSVLRAFQELLERKDLEDPVEEDDDEAKLERVTLLRQAVIFHSGAMKQLDRTKTAHKAMMDEVTLDKWVNGVPPAGSREAEFTFEYEFHFLLVSAQQAQRALRKLGFAGFERGLGQTLKDLRDWYTHFEDPTGKAFESFTKREGADPSQLTLTEDEVCIAGTTDLTTLEAALIKIGTLLPNYEKLVIAEE